MDVKNLPSVEAAAPVLQRPPFQTRHWVLAYLALGLLVAFTLQATGFVSSDEVSHFRNDSENIRASLRPPAKDLTLRTAEGQPLRLRRALQNGPVVLDFSALWCPPCRREMPHLQNVYARYKARGVQILAVNSTATASELVSYARLNGLAFPFLMDTGNLLGDYYHVDRIPLVLVISQDGRVCAEHQGYSETIETDLSGDLDRSLGG